MHRHSDERIVTRCPACRNQTLFVGAGGHLTCSWLKCPNPSFEEARSAAADHAAVLATLAAFTQIHEHWEFEDLSEADFDAWLHGRIKELRGTNALKASAQEYAGVAQGESTRSVSERMPTCGGDAQGTEPGRSSRPAAADETRPLAPLLARDYQREVGRTLIDAPDFTLTPQEMMLAWNALGLAGEAGEAADCIKKAVFHRHGVDLDKLRKELGDVLWYVAAIATKLNLTLDDVMVANIEKLKARYPEGWDAERSRLHVGASADAVSGVKVQA